mmetsp:Transcript_69501/g.220010  ORF Transcript_69501/g.220010 Transcript_69501/m.220010 type:complete len:86 (-) Transcript_69501:689-946(-)
MAMPRSPDEDAAGAPALSSGRERPARRPASPRDALRACIAIPNEIFAILRPLGNFKVCYGTAPADPATKQDERLSEASKGGSSSG